VEAIRRAFGPFGGVEVEPHPNEPIPDPIDFGDPIFSDFADE
jgi:hypothetical protein